MSPADEKILEAFEKIRKKFNVQNASLHKGIELGEMTIISCNGKIGQLIGKKGIIVGELSKELNSRVRLVENTKDHRKIVEDLIGNARLLGMNEIYTPAGSEYKVIVQKNDRHKLTAAPEELEKAMQELLETKTTIEFR